MSNIFLVSTVNKASQSVHMVNLLNTFDSLNNHV